MKLRLTGIYEVHQPAEEYEFGRRRRSSYFGMKLEPGQRIIVGQLQMMEAVDECFSFDVPIEILGTNPKLGDQFEVILKPLQ